ncbi:ABC transporter permease [Candidatus Saccharibacteria bacterium]|nr:ABC transporter permease [Candidatus Saccharibacteria bacterium]
MILSKKDRVILREMVVTDFKLRYQDSVLGYLWSLARPILMFGVLYVVFVYVFGVGDTIENYPTYLLLGIVTWTFFTEMTQRSVSVIVERGDLIRKIALPRHLLVLAVSVAATINFFLSLVAVFIAAVLSGADVSRYAGLGIFLFAELYFLSLGVSLILSAVYVKLRDVSYLWDITVQAGFYATPILYPISKVPLFFQDYILLNPVAQIMQDLRYLFVTQGADTVWKTNGIYGLFPVALVVLIFVTGWIYFGRAQKMFAERV